MYFCVPYLSVTSAWCLSIASCQYLSFDASCVWFIHTLRKLLWMAHILTVSTWPWWRRGFDSPFCLERESPQPLPALILLESTRPRRLALRAIWGQQRECFCLVLDPRHALCTRYFQHFVHFAPYRLVWCCVTRCTWFLILGTWWGWINNGRIVGGPVPSDWEDLTQLWPSGAVAQSEYNAFASHACPVGWLISGFGARLTAAPHLSALLFHPHYPRQWCGQGACPD